MTAARPGRTPSSAPFWDGAEEGRLLVQRCQTCAAAVFPPQADCPCCWSDQLAWELASGRGRLLSHVVNARVPMGERVEPYATALVELEEGVRLLTRVLGPVDALAVDGPVVVTFDDGVPAAHPT